jgi:hypothetical protein
MLLLGIIGKDAVCSHRKELGLSTCSRSSSFYVILGIRRNLSCGLRLPARCGCQVPASSGVEQNVTSRKHPEALRRLCGHALSLSLSPVNLSATCPSGLNTTAPGVKADEEAAGVRVG